MATTKEIWALHPVVNGALESIREEASFMQDVASWFATLFPGTEPPRALRSISVASLDLETEWTPCSVQPWEMVWFLSKLGSVEKVLSTYPGLTYLDLARALAIALHRPEEIEHAVERYLLYRSKISFPS